MAQATDPTMSQQQAGVAAPLSTPNDLGANATARISGTLNGLLADAFALYLKTKNFHWHVSGPHFRDYHLLFEEQADQILASTDVLAERVRKLGGTTLRSISHIARTQRVRDNDAEYVDPQDMLAELQEDNGAFAARLREAHGLCEELRDVASVSVLEPFIDEAERRRWFLFETARGGHRG
jgi:starvation-inducible DNA-binding protein